VEFSGNSMEKVIINNCTLDKTKFFIKEDISLDFENCDLSQLSIPLPNNHFRISLKSCNVNGFKPTGEAKHLRVFGLEKIKINDLDPVIKDSVIDELKILLYPNTHPHKWSYLDIKDCDFSDFDMDLIIDTADGLDVKRFESFLERNNIDMDTVNRRVRRKISMSGMFGKDY
jgi:uncharacterized protein YjbK